MEIKKNYVEQVIEKERYHKQLLIVSIILSIISLAIFLTGYYPISALLALLVNIINTIRCANLKKSDQNKILDFSKSKIELSDDSFTCVQTTLKNEIEECNIYFRDIAEIIEDTKSNQTGFYVIINDNSSSEIYQSSVLTGRKSFYINGIGYDIAQFRQFYYDVISSVDENTSVIGTKTQKNWRENNIKDEIWLLLIPYSVLVLTTFAHIILSFI